MGYELELNKANRLKIARALRGNKRVDFAIDTGGALWYAQVVKAQ